MSDERDAYDGEDSAGGVLGPGPEPRPGGRGGGPGIAGGRSREAGGRLPEELRALGRSLDAPGGAGAESMVEQVLERILAERVPVPVVEPPSAVERLRAVRRWTRTRWRSLTAGLCGVLTVLVLTPPVRAAVVDWFDFGGVEIRYDPSAVPSPGSEVPGCGRSVSLAQAGGRAGFEPLVPGALGTPDTVTVTGAPRGRFLVSLCWRDHGHTIRLDEYPARLDVSFTKTVAEQPEWLVLDSGTTDSGVPDSALWFPRPHLLSFWLVDAEGNRFTRSERPAGPTLLWPHDAADGGGSLVLRLEGVASKGRAVEIAKSLGQWPEKSSR